MPLSTHDHDRGSAGLKYVYPVVSRRARGLSIGINLNPNNACNFRCIYCQVPSLIRGKAPVIDIDLLEDELGGILERIVHGDFLAEHVPTELRRLNDIAFSGNGEPTSAAEFTSIIDRVGKTMREFDLQGEIKVVLITNGSLIHLEEVREGLRRLKRLDGEVWFKLDTASEAGQVAINGNRGGVDRTRRNLAISCSLCPTWLQSCALAIDGKPPSEEEREAYLDLVRWVQKEELPLLGVQLYGLARPSCQPEAKRLAPLSPEAMEAWAERIRALGIEVRVSV
jgi:wyosine [tRNA(Phe)-imidazoG37] synthetase (radical SAM superfamily)